MCDAEITCNTLATYECNAHHRIMSDPTNSPRLAARALIVHEDRLLLVNAFANHHMNLWCAPGGGVERGASLPDNLKREVFEETGLQINVGALAIVNEFHDPKSTFHQVDLIFHCTLKSGTIAPDWEDVAGVVNKWSWATRDEMAQMNIKPSGLADIAFGPVGPAHYDPLEPIMH
jgi:ADP-ribose pyrophosphatase YjhB (NUDIX family)